MLGTLTPSCSRRTVALCFQCPLDNTGPKITSWVNSFLACLTIHLLVYSAHVWCQMLCKQGRSDMANKTTAGPILWCSQCRGAQHHSSRTALRKRGQWDSQVGKLFLKKRPRPTRRTRHPFFLNKLFQGTNHLIHWSIPMALNRGQLCPVGHYLETFLLVTTETSSGLEAKDAANHRTAPHNRGSASNVNGGTGWVEKVGSTQPTSTRGIPTT